jgi:aminoglycoside phosphotransferase (APT) family kinase protein
MVRQARIIQELGGSLDIAVPNVLAVDVGAGVEEPPFFAMQFVKGDAWEPLQDAELLQHQIPFISGRAMSAARMLAQLHTLDPKGLELGDERSHDLKESVELWARAFRTVDPLISAGFEECEAELVHRTPAPMPDRVLHGDWRLGNMLCQRDRIRAVIDWEIWSIGDPRSDLAWFRLAADPEHPRAYPDRRGMPAPDELSHAYAVSGGGVSDLWWFDAFVRFKQSAIAALNGKRLVDSNSGINPYAEISRRLLETARNILSSA